MPPLSLRHPGARAAVGLALVLSLFGCAARRPIPSLPGPECLRRGGPLGPGLACYDAGDYPCALTELSALVEGRATLDELDRHMAEFFLGKTYFKLGQYHEALLAFGQIALTGRKHVYFIKTLGWLGSLSEYVTEQQLRPFLDPYYGFDVQRFIDFIGEAEDPQLRDVLGRMCYLVGKIEVERVGGKRDAIALFARVPPGTHHHAAAQALLAELRGR